MTLKQDYERLKTQFMSLSTGARVLLCVAAVLLGGGGAAELKYLHQTTTAVATGKAGGVQITHASTGDNSAGIVIDTGTGALNVNSHKIVNLTTGTVSTDGANVGQIAATRLDQFAAPTNPVGMNSQKLTSLANGSASTDSAAFGQIASSIIANTYKNTVNAWATSNVASMSGTGQTVDGVALNTANMRTLLTAQTTVTQDGCWVVGAGSWTRCTDLAAGASASGAFFVVEAGTSNKGVAVITNAAGSDVAGTNDLTAINVAGAGGGGAVASVFGRTGTVIAQSGDYSLTLVSAPTADFAMASHGFTGMRAGTTTGEGVTYEQVSDAIKAQSVGTLSFYRQTDEFDRVLNTSGTGVIANATLFGTVPWRAGFAGTGAAVSGVTTNQDTTHIGVLDLNTGTTTTGSANLTGSGVGIQLLGSGMTAREDWIAQVSALSNGTDTYQTRFGYMDSTTAPTNGLYWEYVQATSVNWRCVAMSASTPTVASGGSNVAVATATWQHLEMDWDGTNVTCKVDGTSLGTIAGAALSATPTALIAEITKSAGTTAAHIYFDLYQRSRTYSPPKAN